MSRVRTRLSIATALVAALAASCQLAATNVHNLEELHASDGRHKRTGYIWNDYEYAVRVGIRGLLKGIGSSASTEKPESIDDPLEVCVDNLNELAGIESDDRWVLARQVELCARIAGDDPWCLSREIAVRELGRHGARLGLRGSLPTPPPESPADVETVRSALQRLVQASGATARAELGAQVEFADACDAIRSLPLDRDGASRLLRSVAAIERMLSSSAVELRELSLDLQRRCVTFALQRALADEPPTTAGGSDPGWNNAGVRAAAIEASVEAFGEPQYARLLLEFATRVRDVERLLAFLTLVRQRGLPAPPADVPEAERAALAERWTEAVYRCATEHPEARVRVEAMSALGTLTGRARSVREEDWQDWWLAREAAKPRSSGP